MLAAQPLVSTIQALLHNYEVLQDLADRLQEDLRSKPHVELETVMELHHILGDLQIPFQDLKELLSLIQHTIPVPDGT